MAARHPQTGLGVYQFTQPCKAADTADDSITLSRYGDRARRQFGLEFGAIALEGNVLFNGHGESIYGENALMQMELAKELGVSGRDLLDWTRQGLICFAKYAYEPDTNQLKPMFTDGVDLTGYALKRNGYFGKAGSVLKREPADGKFLLVYARAFLYTKDDSLWATARLIGKGIGLGELGAQPGRGVQPNLQTGCADVQALLASVDLYKATSNRQYLKLGGVIAGNIEKAYFFQGYFTKGPGYGNAKFDAVEPLGLLALEAAMRGNPDAVPTFIGSNGYTGGDYQEPDGAIRNAYDWELYNTTG